MNPDDATTILARLKAAFPLMTLDDEESELLVEQCALLADPSILEEAVGYLIQKEERFPPIARIRLAYRSVADARRVAAAALAPPPPARGSPDVPGEIPEWIHVWFWYDRRTMLDRQKARTGSRGDVADRAPVPMRSFPQMRTGYIDENGATRNEPAAPAVRGQDGELKEPFTSDEYEQIRRAWEKAGSPTVGSVAELLAVAGG